MAKTTKTTKTTDATTSGGTKVTRALLVKAAKLRDSGATWNGIREQTGTRLGSSQWFRHWEREGIEHRPARPGIGPKPKTAAKSKTAAKPKPTAARKTSAAKPKPKVRTRQKVAA